MKAALIVSICLISSWSWGSPNQGKNILKDKTKIENPFNLRDPFKAPPVKSSKGKLGYEDLGQGRYTNIPDPKLDQVSINQIKLVGVLIGKERRAMINLGGDKGGKKIIILKEGMKIGPDQAELKAILPGGIVIVEKMINVYGEEEFLETVIPISK